jgi:ferredoxin
MRANVDRDLCIGCNLCVEICPEVFAMGEDMIAKVIVDEVPAALEEKTADAKASCPVDAISTT